MDVTASPQSAHRNITQLLTARTCELPSVLSSTECRSRATSQHLRRHHTAPPAHARVMAPYASVGSSHKLSSAGYPPLASNLSSRYLTRHIVALAVFTTGAAPQRLDQAAPVLTALRLGPRVSRPEASMRTSRFTDEQSIAALRQAEAGTTAADICRKLGVTETTFYRWKRRFGDLGVSEVRELEQLREENRKLKTLVAELALDKTILHEALKRKW